MKLIKSYPTLLFVLLLLQTTTGWAQNAGKLYQKATEEFSAGSFTNALNYFQEVRKVDQSYQDLEYRLELCSLLTKAGENNSLDKFKGLESQYAAEDDHYHYWLGQIYLKRYQIQDAIKAFQRFQEVLIAEGKSDDEGTKELLEHTLALKKYFDNPDNYEIHQLESPVNSVNAELSPVYFEDKKELLFTSDRDGSGPEPFRVFYTKSKGAKSWENPVEVKTLGSFPRANANLEVVNDDGKLFIFRNENGGDLFYSQSTGDTWTMPVEFDSKVSNNQLDAHFFINEHEDRILFSTNVNNQGLDLFESFKSPENGKWSRPSPFYSSVNSEYDEDSPYLSADENTIYFSSNRPGGVGGLDIYQSTYDPQTYSWSEPVNMGWPINSPDDEYHFKMNADQSSGYMISNRLRTLGDYDIYFFWEVEKVKVQGRIFDAASNGPLKDGEIRFHPSQYLEEYFGATVDETGRYLTSIISDEIFKIEILRNGQVIYEENFEIHETDGSATTYVKNFSIK